MNEESSSTPALLPVHEVARRLSVCKATVYNMVHEGRLNPPRRISARRSGWPESEINEFIESLEPVEV